MPERRNESSAARVRVTVTMEYVPEPESYEYPEGVEELSVAEMAKQDAAIYHEGNVGIQDVLEWGEVLSVAFEAARTDSGLAGTTAASGRSYGGAEAGVAPGEGQDASPAATPQVGEARHST